MISVTAPIDRALTWTKQILFNPFDFEKWFVLGFCAFLAGLAEGGGGGGSFRSPFPHEAGPDWGPFTQAGNWVMGHLHLVIGLGLLLLILIVALVALFQWLGSRGQFMFLDGVVHNRAAVVEPWHRFRTLGNDLFVFRFTLGLCGLGAFALLGGVGWLVARPDIEARHFGSASALALLVAGGPALLVVLALAIVSLLLNDFVVPVMYRREIGTGQAFGILWKEIVLGHGGVFVLFYLMRIVLGLASFLIIAVGTCCTCCLALLPYLGTVIFLPVFVFFRSYSLHFLAQFGEEWRLVGGPDALPEPPEQSEA